MSGIGNALGSIAGSVVGGMFNSREAEKNRDFQAEMSNTSYQRAVRDMRAAGINPILAAKLGGASTPAGAVANWPDFGQTFNNAISAQAAQTQAETQKEKAEEEKEKIKAETKMTEKQTEVFDVEIKRKEAEIDQIKSRTDLNKAITELPKLIADVIKAVRSAGEIQDVEKLKAGVRDVLTIRIKKDASHYEGDEENRPWFNFELNKERQLK